MLAALKRIAWRHDRTVGSHKILKRDGWADYPFSFHDSEELGPARRCACPYQFNRAPSTTMRLLLPPPAPVKRPNVGELMLTSMVALEKSG